jgi:Zn-finger nucleic acid-binding protein
MMPRRSVARVNCPACGDELEPVFLGGVDVDRCAHDELVWFDRGELGLVLEIARDQEQGHEQSWLRQVLDLWFG